MHWNLKNKLSPFSSFITSIRVFIIDPAFLFIFYRVKMYRNSDILILDHYIPYNVETGSLYKTFHNLDVRWLSYSPLRRPLVSEPHWGCSKLVDSLNCLHWESYFVKHDKMWQPLKNIHNPSSLNEQTRMTSE